MRLLLATFGLSALLTACDGAMPTAPTAMPPLLLEGHARLADQPLNIESLDVDSIEVIKGPAAAALYGSHGCSAILVVTTRPRPHADRQAVSLPYFGAGK